MNSNRRRFLKNAAILSGAAGLNNVMPSSIKKALSINAEKGTTFYDAEHIVFLMQENRSFDHIFGCMKGARGFNDPRIKTLPDGNKAWIQKSKNGDAHAPFHIDINKTKVTWQGGLPHDWPDQSRARNNGKYDQWIPQKTEMCMGYYNRTDLPFYYALADAFTLCDHYFCSSLTGTTPNRLFYWTGTIRAALNGNSRPAVRNAQAESRDDTFVDWSTFPELLEDNDISWRIYQNEIWTAHLDDNTDYWLGNYGDNAIEYVKRHQVKLAAYFRKHGYKKSKPALNPQEVLTLYNQCSQKEKNLIDKAFTGNIDLEDYLQLAPYTFIDDTGKEQTINIPSGDIFHEFRKDVNSGNLPTVSWLVAPQAFSDHTSSPLYGTWYVSEALNILTQNPEVWKKTIFILNYDENDGYFDHLAPFVVPNPQKNGTGKVSESIDISSDFDNNTGWPIGLGYRVPMIIASPWSKGGFINSQIHDHTSTIMFLEKFLQKKTGKIIQSKNISSWRRSICGNLTSAFRPYNGERFPLPEFLKKTEVINHIQNAHNKPAQAIPKALTVQEISVINEHPTFANHGANWIAEQEKGVRPACALPYILYADCEQNNNKNGLQIRFKTAHNYQQTGAAFNMYTPSAYDNETGKTWFYAVKENDVVEDELLLSHFKNQTYDLCIQSANGFFRHYRGNAADCHLKVDCNYEIAKNRNQNYTGNILLSFENFGDTDISLLLTDNAYGKALRQINLKAQDKQTIKINLKQSQGWYDFTITEKGNKIYKKQYAGHVETGQTSITDPLMGGLYS